ncbi:MAG TPA: outer membrane protein assembly factor BamA [Xanthomonadaceae bacterium]|nr:outer membrane protein assembly factor BamA [Xanthomonadaceae bacterium]
MTRITAAILVALALARPVAAQSGEDFVVSDIRVEGLQRISAGTVFTYLPVERGDMLTRERAGEAIRALFDTGFFSDVSLKRQGDILVVEVEERPAINTITITGNKDIKEEELMAGLKDIGLSEGETFNRLQLDRITQELTRQYNNRGKYNVKVTPNITELDRNRIDVAIVIAEGKAAKIRHINIVGNEAYPDEDIVKNWESGTTNWLSWYTRGDQYSREKLSGDLEKLASYYLDRGYVDFNVESTQVSIAPDRRDMYLTANVREGDVYTFGEVTVTGDTVIPAEQIQQLVVPREGATFSRRQLEATSDAMVAVLSNIGYAFAEVTPIPEIDRENLTVDINFFVEPGQRVNVRRIVFKGNTRTADEVLRREMRQFEGAWYSQAALDRSKIRMQRLGYFESVDIETPRVAGTEDQVDVEIAVKERTSGSFVFGLGYSQLSGLITSLSVTENNFFGTGNRIGMTLQNNRFVRRFDLSYFDPYFTDSGISVGYNLVYRELDQRERNIANYTTDNGAIQAVFGLPLTETDSVAVSVGIDSNEIRPFVGTPTPIIDYIDAVNNRTFHAWRTEISFARDSRNAFYNPTRGTFQRIAAEVALPGSTVEYYKLFYEIARYWPISRNFILLTSAQLGYGDSYGDEFVRDIPILDGEGEPVLDDMGNPTFRTVRADGLPFFENFYAGGVRSVRGFEDNTLGPSFLFPGETNPDFAQPLGGALKTVGSVELIYPNLFESDAFRIANFIDVGNVFADLDAFDAGDLRASIGISLQWQAPIGPIEISFAQPIVKEDEDRIEKIQFTFGTQF